MLNNNYNLSIKYSGFMRKKKTIYRKKKANQTF